MLEKTVTFETDDGLDFTTMQNKAPIIINEENFELVDRSYFLKPKSDIRKTMSFSFALNGPRGTSLGLSIYDSLSANTERKIFFHRRNQVFHYF